MIYFNPEQIFEISALIALLATQFLRELEKHPEFLQNLARTNQPKDPRWLEASCRWVQNVGLSSTFLRCEL